MTNIDNFKLFVKKNPNLINYVRDNSMSWQKFYELYDLYGEDNNVWNKYLNNNSTTETRTKSETNSNSSRFTDILNMAKNIDADRLQEGITSVQKAISLIGDMLVKDNKSSQTSTYTPRPIYRKFDD